MKQNQLSLTEGRSGQLVSVSDAARLLGVTRQTVYRWQARGELRAVTENPPKFARNDVDLLSRKVPIRPASSGPKTRERILLAAARLIERSGIGSCTMEAVALEAGVSRGGLLHHFVDKDDMMLALAQAFTSSVDSSWEQLRKSDPSLDIASAYILVTNESENHYGAAVLLGSTTHEAARAHVAGAIQGWYSAIAEQSSDPSSVTRCLAADGLWILSILRANPLSPELHASVTASLTRVGEPPRIQPARASRKH